MPTDTTTTTSPTTAAPTIDPSASTLSPNFAPYVYDMLSMGQGLANLPFQPYTGDRFAGPSGLQQQAFIGIGGLQVPGSFGTAGRMLTQAGRQAGATDYDPTRFRTGLGPVRSVQDYMNPYTSNVTNILVREATRQADIQRQADQARLAQAGGYGGGRQAILDAERARNLSTQIGDIREKGLSSAWEQAQKQRLSEAGLGLEAQKFGEQSRQFGADLGLRGLAQQIQAGQGLGQLGTAESAAQRANLGLQLDAGEAQRKLTQDPLDFAYSQWQESMKWPYQQATFMSSLLQGLPLAAKDYGAGQSSMNAMLSGILSGLGLEQYLNNQGN